MPCSFNEFKILMHYLENFDTSRKVVGSVPDGVIGIFHLLNTSDSTMGLKSTQPLREVIMRCIS